MSHRRFSSFLTSLCFCACSLQAAYQQEPVPNPTEIRVLSVDPTPEAEEVEIKILYPLDNDLEKKNPVGVQIRLDGFPLRTYSQFPRAKEVLNYNKEGQSLHIFIDNEPYFIENVAIVSALQVPDFYYQQNLEFNIPYTLKPGQHILRVFPARSYGESLKGDGCFEARAFFVGGKTPLLDVDLDQPYLTYNQPQGDIKYEKNRPILLDFYLANIKLSRDGYKVRLTIDGNVRRILTRWCPYYVYGLKQGQHTFKLELLNEANQVVPGLFNKVERVIMLK
jgi:hypothetical protein